MRKQPAGCRRRSWSPPPARCFSGQAQASGPIPDASCGQESSLRSLNDNTPAVVNFVNNTSETLETFWLNFSGKRVFYSQIPAGGSYNQKTWITHPWIVADLNRTCLKLYDTSATQATVVVSDTSTTSSPATTPQATPTSSADVTPTAGAAAGSPGAGTGAPGSGLPVPLLIAVLSAIALAAGAALAASQGWIGGKPPSPLLTPGGPLRRRARRLTGGI